MATVIAIGAAIGAGAVYAICRHRTKKVEFLVNHLYKTLAIPKPPQPSEHNEPQATL